MSVITKHGFITTRQRSELMSKISSGNTKPELKLRKHLWKLGIRYRINNFGLYGKPDIILKKYKLAIFIDGEFWHGYNWREKKNKIKSNRGYWIKKIEGNMERDRRNTISLESDGWKVLRFWDFEINKDLTSCVEKILGRINEERNNLV